MAHKQHTVEKMLSGISNYIALNQLSPDIQEELKLRKMTYTDEMKDTNHINSYCMGFLRKVEGKQNGKCYCASYRGNSLVKPYFDLDLKTKCGNVEEKKEEIIQKAVEYIREEFIDEMKHELLIADNSRRWKNKKEQQKGGYDYYISFHIILNSNVFIKVKNMLNIIKHFNKKAGEKIFDESVYKECGGILRFSNQVKTGTTNKPKFYCINEENEIVDYDLTKVMINAYEGEEHESDLPPFEKVQNKNLVVPMTNDEGWVITPKQEKLLIEILNDLPPKSDDTYDEWVKMCMIMVWYSATEKSFQLFHDWSKKGKNYDSEDDCRKLWNSIKNSKRKHNLLTIATLIDKHIEFCEKNKRITKNYRILLKPIPYDPLGGLKILLKISKTLLYNLALR